MTLQCQKIFISIACIRCLSASQCWTVLYISSSLNINMQMEPNIAFSRSIVQLDSDNTVTHLLPIVWVLKLVYEGTMKSNYYTSLILSLIEIETFETYLSKHNATSS